MGGYMLVHVFPGPTPRDVVTQISEHLGRLERMPPLWATGYHVCRFEMSAGFFQTQLDDDRPDWIL